MVIIRCSVKLRGRAKYKLFVIRYVIQRSQAVCVETGFQKIVTIAAIATIGERKSAAIVLIMWKKLFSDRCDNDRGDRSQIYLDDVSDCCHHIIIRKALSRDCSAHCDEKSTRIQCIVG